MPHYKYKDSSGRCDEDELTVIEDKGMFTKNSKGEWQPGFEFIDSHTVKAHPFIIEALLEDAERLWSMDEVLEELDA